MEAVKLVVIGGGSSYTPELIDGLIRHHDEFPVRQLVLVDVKAGLEKMSIIQGLVNRMFQAAGLSVPVDCMMDRRAAIEGADFIVTQFRVGGLGARARDERIPLTFGLIGQETTGAGGFAKALRTIPVVREIAADIQSAAPHAWVINFTNPSGIITETFLRCGHDRTIGLCNVPVSMQRAIAAGLGAAPERLRLQMIGLNHLSWARRVWLDDKDITGEILESPFASQEIVSNTPPGQADPDFLRELGLLPSPYLKYYYFPRHVVNEQLQAIREGRGTRADEVMAVEDRLFEHYRDPSLTGKPPELGERGGAWYSETAVSVMCSIHGNRSDMHVVNARNSGAIGGLSSDSVVETNCVVDGSGVHPMCSGPLPQAIRGLVQHVKNYEELTIEAGWNGNSRMAVQALATHPLVGDVSVARDLWAALLEANSQFLPQFSGRGVSRE